MNDAATETASATETPAEPARASQILVVNGDARHVLAFLLAGNSHATFVSRKTGTRFTYRLRAPKEGSKDVRFVAVLTGPDDYRFVGTVFLRDRQGADQAPRFVYSPRSSIGATAPSVKAFEWVWRRLAGGQATAGVEIWHEGRCGKCGRRLTDPESISTGLGPVCAGGR
jgi:hypothetical protein